jgi:hypothetical protein
MNANEKNERTLKLFTTRMRQMILQFTEMKSENVGLCVQVAERDARIKELEAQLTQAKSNYESLKMAKMIEISDRDLDGAQKRLAKLIRDVNKCITLLSEK